MMHMAHLTIHGFIGIGSHQSVNPPSVVPVITPHISADTLLGLTIKAKYSPTVIGPFGFQCIAQGNDSGFVVPHIGIPPNNVLIPLVIFFGGSKPMFAASTVPIDCGGAKPMACNVIPYAPVGLNQACNDPCNYPSDIVICPNTVVVGMTLGDFLAGLAATVLDVAISGAASWLGGNLGKWIVGRIAGVVARPMASEIAEGLARESGEKMGEQALKELAEGVGGNLAERPIAHFAAQLVEKLFGVGVDQAQDASGAGPAMDRGIHNAADGPAPAGGSPGSSNPASTSSNALTGADGSDPRVHSAN